MLTKRKGLILSLLGVALFACWPEPEEHKESGVLDIRFGEYLADTLDRSTYDLSRLQLRSTDYTHILLTPFEMERPRSPQVQFRTGDETVVLPFIPARGDLFVEAGVVYDMELGFYNFLDLAPTGTRDMRTDFDAEIAGTPADDIEAIIALHDAFRASNWAADSLAFCRIHKPTRPAYEWCMAEALFDGYWPDNDELRDVLQAFQEEHDAGWNSDDWDIINDLPKLTIGQWVSETGLRVEARVRQRFDVTAEARKLPPSEKSRGIGLYMRFIVEHNPSFLNLRSCFHAANKIDPTFESLQRYTPTQAKIVFGGLRSAFLNEPTVDSLGDVELLLADFAMTSTDIGQQNAAIGEFKVLSRDLRKQRLAEVCQNTQKLHNFAQEFVTE